MEDKLKSGFNVTKEEKEMKFKLGEHVEINSWDTDLQMHLQTVGVVIAHNEREGDKIWPYVVKLYLHDGTISERWADESDLDYLMPSKPYRMRKKYIPGNISITMPQARQIRDVCDAVRAEGKHNATDIALKVPQSKPVSIKEWSNPIGHNTVYGCAPAHLSDDQEVRVTLRTDVTDIDRVGAFNWGEDMPVPCRIKSYQVRVH